MCVYVCPGPGSFKIGLGSGSCELCPAGTFSSDFGSGTNLTCAVCPARANSPKGATSQASCSCNAGYEGDNGGPCTLCVAGSYKVTAGSESCTLCEEGKFGTETGALNGGFCQSCPLNTSAPSGSDDLSDCTCEIGTFGPAGGPCEPCPAGLWCAGGMKNACPSHASSDVGSDAETDCQCHAGYLGQDGGPCNSCPADRWCPGRQVSRSLHYKGHCIVPHLMRKWSSACIRFLQSLRVLLGAKQFGARY